MLYVDLINAAVSNAIRNLDPPVSPNVDAQGIAETLFPSVSQAVSKNAAASPAMRALLRRQKTVTLAAGEATLPGDVLIDYFEDATLLNTALLNSRYAYRDYPDFVRRGDRRMGTFTRNGVTLMVCDPSQPFTQPLAATGARLLTTPCQVVRPAAAGDTVVGPEQLMSDIVDALSEALRGQLVKVAGEAT